MDDNSLGCPTCGIPLDERELVSKSLTVEKCPKCGTTVRTTDGFSGMNLAAVIAGDVAEIDTWLDKYAYETSQQIAKRDLENDHGFLWAVGTSHKFACECFYDQKKTGFVAIRMVTKTQAETVIERRDRLTDVAARFTLQPHHVRHSGWNISDGSSTDAVWGMVQYLDINSLTITLLTSATERINDAMQLARSEILGDAEA